MSGIKITPSGSGLLPAASRSGSGFVCEVEEEKPPARLRCQGAKHRPGCVGRRCHQVRGLKLAALHLSSRCLPYICSHICKVWPKNRQAVCVWEPGLSCSKQRAGHPPLGQCGLGERMGFTSAHSYIRLGGRAANVFTMKCKAAVEVGGGRLSFHLHLGHR